MVSDITRKALRLASVAVSFIAVAPTVVAADPGDARAILSELVAVNTSPALGTRETAEILRDHFLRAGFRVSDISIVARPSAPEKANLVVRLRGRGKARPLLYMSHLDVVPAEPEDWTVPPFKLTEQEGWLYGRGVLDMKGEAANVAAAMIRLRKEAYAPPGDIVAVFSPDEETRGEDGIVWLIQSQPALFDVKLILNPDAPVAVFRHGKRAYYGVQTSEKLYATFEVEVTNRGGHSSEPRPDSAIYSLTAGLNRLADYRFLAKLTHTVRAYYAAQAKFATGERKADMEAVGRSDIKAADRLSGNPTDNAQLRTTCIATMLEAGHAENALPQRAVATVQCRLVPGENVKVVQAQLTTVLADPKIKLSLRYADAAAEESKPTDAILDTFKGAVHSLWPELPVVPVMDAGGSDSLFTRTLGIPTFGAPSIFVDHDDIRAHGRDERIRSERFTEGTDLAYRIMKAFSEAP